MFTHSKKQKEFIVNANHRWNFKSGAVRSGKSFEDVSFQIIYRIRQRKGLGGLNVIIGVSKSTIERNVLEPMREIYTHLLVSTINSQNICYIAGEPVYCIGAEKESQVAKIQGSSIKYCYGDEVAKWNRAVFEMLESRLDKEYSCFDGSCNPEDPNHWLKAFLDRKDLDIYLQEYTIFDNPFLPKVYVDNLCREYSASDCLFQRLILGKWVRSEGVIYQKFASKPSDYIITEIPKMSKIVIGVDFGSNGSWHSFSAVGYGKHYSFIVILESIKYVGTTTSDELSKLFVEYVNMISAKYEQFIDDDIFEVYCDNADAIHIRDFKVAVCFHNLPAKVKNARKMKVKDRIELINRAFGLKIIYIMMWNTNAIESFQQAVYDDRDGHQDERLDNETTNKFGHIDTLDSIEYAVECEYKNLANTLERGVLNG